MRSTIEEIKRGDRVESWVATIVSPAGQINELLAYDQAGREWMQFVVDACNQALPAPAKPEDEGDEFTIPDPELNELLNLSVDLVKGNLGQDGATLWKMHLDAVLARLKATDPTTLANRFLAWPLPASVCSDPCATVLGQKHRFGTNLLSFDAAKAMFEYVLKDQP